jgi:hypothetical protein
MSQGQISLLARKFAVVHLIGYKALPMDLLPPTHMGLPTLVHSKDRSEQ